MGFGGDATYAGLVHAETIIDTQPSAVQMVAFLVAYFLRRRHFSRASRSWITNGSRGGLPRLAPRLHTYRADFPKARSSWSDILRSRARRSSRSISSLVSRYVGVGTSSGATPAT